MKKSTEQRHGRTAFGRRMWQARQSKGLSQPEVARALGIAQSTVSDAETRAAGSSHVAAFAELYGCNPHWLATGEGDRSPLKMPRSFEAQEVARMLDEITDPGLRERLYQRFVRLIDELAPKRSLQPPR